MTKVIYKYPLRVTHEQFLMLPRGGVPVFAGVQKEQLKEQLFVWAEVVEDEYVKETCTFKIYGTGHIMDEDTSFKYLQTIFAGDFVWHVYYSIDPQN